MAKVSPIQSNFSAGEFSPLAQGRVDSDRYKTGLALCKNWIPTLQGGLTRRPGTHYVATVKTVAKKTRLVAFQFSDKVSYMLEFGHLYIRVYKNNGQILSGGSPYEIVTPYTESDLFNLSFTQSADTLYIVNTTFKPRKLTRISDTGWSLNTISFLDGPYLSTNADTSNTLTPGGTSGTVGFTLISAGLQIGQDEGRPIRMKDSAGNWTWAVIASVTNTVSGTMTIKGPNLPNTTAMVSWRLGFWTGSEDPGFANYPAVVVFHEDRLTFGGTPSAPQRFDASCSGDYENFQPTAVDGTVAANNALALTLNSNDVNSLLWMVSAERGMQAGTFASEWVVSPSQLNEALTGTNVSAKSTTRYGSQKVPVVQAGKATIFVQKAGRKLRELQYVYTIDGYQASDLSVLSEHLTLGGIVDMTFIKEPQPIVWCVRADGVLLSMTYERDLDSLKVGWAQHPLGGTSDAAGTGAAVESVAVIPSADGLSQDLWMIVKRYINGAVTRYVEYMSRPFDDSMAQKDAFFVDAGSTYDAPKTISGATNANAVVITSAAHGFSNGDQVLISDVAGMSQLNGNTYLVAGVGPNSFQLNTLGGGTIDGTQFGIYISGGKVRKYVSTISGLTQFEGETVSVWADGAYQTPCLVTSGSITLSLHATTVQIGYAYPSDGQMLRLDAGAADGTAIGKTRRMNRVGFLLYRALGLKIGTDFTTMTPIQFNTKKYMGRAPGLFSGITSENFSADYDFENQVAFRVDIPAPCTLLAVMPQMVTQDR